MLYIFQPGSIIAPNASIVPNPPFDNGVVKIQKGAAHDLLLDEKKAVAILRKKAVVTPGLGSTRRARTMEEKLAKRRKKNGDVQDYIDCSFILGSVAEVERL